MTLTDKLSALPPELRERLGAVEEYRDHTCDPESLVTTDWKFADAALAQVLTELQRVVRERDRMRAIIGSVAEHDRVLGAHIAAAMKEYDAERETP